MGNVDLAAIVPLQYVGKGLAQPEPAVSVFCRRVLTAKRSRARVRGPCRTALGMGLGFCFRWGHSQFTSFGPVPVRLYLCPRRGQEAHSNASGVASERELRWCVVFWFASVNPGPRFISSQTRAFYKAICKDCAPFHERHASALKTASTRPRLTWLGRRKRRRALQFSSVRHRDGTREGARGMRRNENVARQSHSLSFPQFTKDGLLQNRFE